MARWDCRSGPVPCRRHAGWGCRMRAPRWTTSLGGGLVIDLGVDPAGVVPLDIQAAVEHSTRDPPGPCPAGGEVGHPAPVRAVAVTSGLMRPLARTPSLLGIVLRRPFPRARLSSASPGPRIPQDPIDHPTACPSVRRSSMKATMPGCGDQIQPRKRSWPREVATSSRHRLFSVFNRLISAWRPPSRNDSLPTFSWGGMVSAGLVNVG